MADVPESTQESITPQVTPEARLAAMFTREAGEAETPTAPSAQQVTTDVETPATDENQPAEEAPESQLDDPYEELEHLGKTYQVPASLKKSFEENRAAFTKYSTAEKTLEARANYLQQYQQFVEAESAFRRGTQEEFNELMQLDATFNAYKKAYFDATDAETTSAYKRELDRIEYRRNEVQQALGSKKQQFDQYQAQARNQAIKKGEEYLSKVISNYGDQIKSEISQYAISKGFARKELENIIDPRVVEVMHEASQWRKLQASKPQVANKAHNAPPVIKPGASNSETTVRAAKEKQLRERLHKTGDWKDAAALLASRVR